ncbi:hypothetical protein [Streptomyces sp. CB01881]|uniref:hypothetical protein n=1 Tax=Streptomyces sp. CB01881 TaxID=2078691 RepID=UPI000CDBECBF|nr:hypothetical protein [Streptomyces sp. CB01881]AUY52615.1 hypothetical protein C2142_31050 [Streptomyces sp. CB01881]TYC70334.1 hypothetical protein EH183_31115 [Streptomyces sp. CB01881]
MMNSKVIRRSGHVVAALLMSAGAVAAMPGTAMAATNSSGGGCANNRLVASMQDPSSPIPHALRTILDVRTCISASGASVYPDAYVTPVMQLAPCQLYISYTGPNGGSKWETPRSASGHVVYNAPAGGVRGNYRTVLHLKCMGAEKDKAESPELNLNW